MLTEKQLRHYRTTGHLTVVDVFDEPLIDRAISDLNTWSTAFRTTLREDQKDWYLERDADQCSASDRPLRKLDQPVYYRPVFRQLAKHPRLVTIVEQIIGKGVSVFFSQIFLKPPERGGPKPVHQDNYYFDPSDPSAALTAWIALDAATVDNGCLFYSDTHQDVVLDHMAPEEQPFNLQIPTHVAANYSLSPAPVPRGGVSFHHGNTLHRSAANRSSRPRRAAAFHYLQNDAHLVRPALEYDSSFSVRIT